MKPPVQLGVMASEIHISEVSGALTSCELPRPVHLLGL